MEVLLNANPLFHAVDKRRLDGDFMLRLDQTISGPTAREPITVDEVFEHIRDIRDPEHPHSLEALGVVRKSHLEVLDAEGDSGPSTVTVIFTPTIPHCSMANLIGLSIKVRLQRSLPRRFKIRVLLAEGSHDTADDINKQLADKERIAAAMENASLVRMVNQCLEMPSVN